MSEVWVVGGATVDIFASGLPYLPEADALGDEFTDRSLVHLPSEPVMTVGGNGGNCAYVVASLGAPVRLLTSIGDDVLGRALLSWLRESGCDVTLMPPAQTSINFVARNRGDQRCSFFFPVLSDRDRLSGLARDATVAPGDHVALRGYPHPEAAVLAEWVDRARACGATVSLDIGPASAGFRLGDLEPLLEDLDVLFCNQRELAGLDPTRDPGPLAQQIATRLRGGLVIKRGADGAEYRDEHGAVAVPAHRVNAGMTVGAGDTFDAAFIVATYVQGQQPSRALSFAAAVVAGMLDRGRGVRGVRGDQAADACLAPP